MNKTKMLIIALLFILLPNIIYADCTKEEIDYFKRIENGYKISYEYNKDSKNYTVTFYSPEPDKYEYMIYTEQKNLQNCDGISDNETICHNVLPNEYYIEILGQTASCKDSVKEITLNLSRYNNFSDDPLCEGIEEFVLCQPTYDKEIDYDTFVSRVNTYKKTKKNEQKENTEENKKDNQVIDNISKFLEDNLFQIIIIIVFVIVITITIILTAKSIRKSRRLE